MCRLLVATNCIFPDNDFPFWWAEQFLCFLERGRLVEGGGRVGREERGGSGRVGREGQEGGRREGGEERDGCIGPKY